MIGGIVKAIIGRPRVDSLETFRRELRSVAAKVSDLDPMALNRRLLSLAEVNAARLAKQTAKLNEKIQVIERYRGNPAKYWSKLTALYSSLIKTGRSEIAQVTAVKQLVRAELELQGRQPASRSTKPEALVAQDFRNVAEGGISSLTSKLGIMNGKRGGDAQSVHVEIQTELVAIREQLADKFKTLMNLNQKDSEWQGAVSQLSSRNPCIWAGFNGVGELVASGEESDFGAFERAVNNANRDLRQVLADFDRSLGAIANRATPAEVAQAQTEIQFLSARLGDLGLDERQQANVFRALGWPTPKYVGPRRSSQPSATTRENAPISLQPPPLPAAEFVTNSILNTLQGDQPNTQDSSNDEPLTPKEPEAVTQSDSVILAARAIRILVSNVKSSWGSFAREVEKGVAADRQRLIRKASDFDTWLSELVTLTASNNSLNFGNIKDLGSCVLAVKTKGPESLVVWSNDFQRGLQPIITAIDSEYPELQSPQSNSQQQDPGLDQMV